MKGCFALVLICIHLITSEVEYLFMTIDHFDFLLCELPVPIFCSHFYMFLIPIFCQLNVQHVTSPVCYLLTF